MAPAPRDSRPFTPEGLAVISQLRSRLTYANTVASIALFIALGGTSYGLATGSIDSREIKDNTVGNRDIRNNDVRSKDVRDRTLLAEDFKRGQLPTGPQGAQGLQGAQGNTGAQGVPGPTASGVASVSPASGTSINNAEQVINADITTTFSGRILASLAMEIHRDAGAGFGGCHLELAPSPFTTFTAIGKNIATSGPSGSNREALAAAGRSAVLPPGTYRVRPTCGSSSLWEIDDADLVAWAVAG